MKKTLYLLLILCSFQKYSVSQNKKADDSVETQIKFPGKSSAQDQANQANWTSEQISKANTAKDISFLSDEERDAIMYINLARLYPKDFVKIEMTNYFGTDKYGDFYRKSKFRASLISQLKRAVAMDALVFDQVLYEDAKCFSNEIGEKGQEGHHRKKCKKNNFAECLSYGMNNGKDIAMQWLIDDRVESLGHRKICLDKTYKKIAISVHAHKKWDTCAVAELIW